MSIGRDLKLIKLIFCFTLSDCMAMLGTFLRCSLRLDTKKMILAYYFFCDFIIDFNVIRHCTHRFMEKLQILMLMCLIVKKSSLTLFYSL
jgi:hypothetical protein